MTSKTTTKPTTKSITKTHRSPEAIEGHIAHVGARINELRPVAEQFAKMAAAAEQMQAAMQQVQELRAELDASKAHILQTQADALRVLGVHEVRDQTYGTTAGWTARIEQDLYSQDYGRAVPVQRTVHLQNLTAPEQLAVLDSGKLPPDILKLGGTPAEALAKWQAGYRRGYLTD
ncbi:hypothetical protein [Ralstonia pseudosolanacearum]|uniref:hypothetical protein n=1 Tax=Ralstonia pseudosolanacearum TaxID=1310165 RepID=UPI002674D4F7|nr:hypothetical protein [Ralstonia pseudosolanacearum]MDO3506048.1 hypothetical protein [Ralstonia pseudosolanacearum]MDO3510378.1 hypothetical protein [Ralstonia pseudosolanacearum]MDO3535930.1 hypothetical protein [Ralstonia pseudosolanacearum]MDO3606202.1 hypothetical protein [Ralstonia pseudosolanacearum]MDO3611136.1 hypothetical protein [Ralstonia pseudosolanacearum]